MYSSYALRSASWWRYTASFARWVVVVSTIVRWGGVGTTISGATAYFAKIARATSLSGRLGQLNGCWMCAMVVPSASMPATSSVEAPGSFRAPRRASLT
jgi:hypothetical protein